MTELPGFEESKRAREEALASGRFAIYVPPNGKKLFCVVCGSRGFAWGKWYERHQGEHHFPCDHCEKRFLTNQGLLNHQRALDKSA